MKVYIGMKIIWKKEVVQSPKVKNFYNDNVVSTQYQYCFHIKKCLDNNCKYHKPIIIDEKEFEQIHWLPIPSFRLNLIEESYTDFENMYVLCIKSNDRDRPGGNRFE